MRRLLSNLWTALFEKERSLEVRIVVVGIVLAVVAAIDLAWSSFGEQSDRVALAAGSLTGALLVVAGGAIVGWRKAESRHD
ncbi:hypothetical protein MNBD_ACTINO02-1257 [hydrothermal vent metagenome]|uniref:Uncharacterized protein n=1 Tax=hydrothermal vent metagenome TaxID=652676 RepID=A0A3B0SLL5_9ZZZZ